MRQEKFNYFVKVFGREEAERIRDEIEGKASGKKDSFWTPMLSSTKSSDDKKEAGQKDSFWTPFLSK